MYLNTYNTCVSVSAPFNSTYVRWHDSQKTFMSWESYDKCLWHSAILVVTLWGPQGPTWQGSMGSYYNSHSNSPWYSHIASNRMPSTHTWLMSYNRTGICPILALMSTVMTFHWYTTGLDFRIDLLPRNCHAFKIEIHSNRNMPFKLKRRHETHIELQKCEGPKKCWF